MVQNARKWCQPQIWGLIKNDCQRGFVGLRWDESNLLKSDLSQLCWRSTPLTAEKDLFSWCLTKSTFHILVAKIRNFIHLSFTGCTEVIIEIIFLLLVLTANLWQYSYSLAYTLFVMVNLWNNSYPGCACMGRWGDNILEIICWSKLTPCFCQGLSWRTSRR